MSLMTTAEIDAARLRELWEERAAIMEYDGELARLHAERLANKCVYPERFVKDMTHG